MYKSGRAKYLEFKEPARRLVYDRLAFFNSFYNFKFNRVAIRDQRRCWGSCSSGANLNFNYRIIALPIELADYLIVHELCHLAEMNHSFKFWQLVGQAMPDWRQRRRALKKVVLK